MTNKLEIDRELASVPRELLVNFIEYSVPVAGHCSEWLREKEELRALLAAPVAHQHEWDINNDGTATVCSVCGIRSSDDLAAPVVERQEPVLYQRWYQGMWFKINPADVEKLEADGWKVRRLYAEQPAPVALTIPEECPHLIVFDDTERENLMFSGAGSRSAALKTWEKISMSWNAHLFVRVERNSRDDRYPSAKAAPVVVVNLRNFANAMIDIALDGGSADGAQIQELAIKHGLLKPEQRTERCGDACSCAEYADFPVECFRKVKELNQ